MTDPDQPFAAPDDRPNPPVPDEPYSSVDYPDYPAGYPPPPYPGAPGGPPAYPGAPGGGPPPYPPPWSYPGAPGGPPPYPTYPSAPGGPPPYPPPWSYPGAPGGPPPYPGGWPVADPYRPGPAPGTNGMAIASLVCSLLGWLVCGIPALAGIILGSIAMQQTKQTGQNGYGLALAGVITGAVVLLFSVGFVLMVLGGSP